MQYITPLNKFHPEVQGALKEFARKSHAINLQVVGKIPSNLLDAETDYTRAVFLDPRFPDRKETSDEIVGSLRYSIDNGNSVFTVYSRLIRNEKYRRHTPNFHTKVSKDVAKTVKTMVEVLRPFSYSEIFDFNKRQAKEVISTWRNEHYREGRSAWNLHESTLYEEVKHLKSIGVEFKTKEFAKLATVGIEAWDEYLRRNKQRVKLHHVLIIEGRVALTAKEMDSYNDPVSIDSTVFYNDIESLPGEILGEVAMLKLLDNGQSINGVGMRVTENEFYVMKPLASNTNA